MSNQKKWMKDDSFIKLCDAVATNNLVCLTGAGISKELRLESGSTMPGWKELLINIKKIYENKNLLEEAQKNDLNELLEGESPGENLIECASILYNIDKDIFNEKFCNCVNLEKGATSKVHKELLNLQPRGILTYNYDKAHENAIEELGKTWPVVLPKDNKEIVDLLRNNLKHQFLFKMHGTAEDIESMVLTRESYRNLLNKYPYYKAFIQHVFTNYQLLIIGFGMSDPDFDSLLQNIFSVFGSPIQEHIVIKHKNEKTSKDTLYKLRYGLHFLYVEKFEDIYSIIVECTKHPGALINDILEKCIDEDLSTREKAHSMIKNLSNIGKSCLANILEKRIKENILKENQKDYNLNSITSEYVYTYGVIACEDKNKKYKDFLIENVVNKSNFSEPVAHALFKLRDILDNNDINIAINWIKTFKTKSFKRDPDNPDPHNRVLRYAESIHSFLLAKYKCK